MATTAATVERWAQPTYSALNAASEPPLGPVEVRRIITEHHERIRRLLGRIERRTTRLLSTPVPTLKQRDATRRSALALCAVMAWHIQEEERILLPLVEQADAEGSMRAANLHADHEQQLLLLRAYASALEQLSESGAALALIAWQLVEMITEDMAQEEAAVLSLPLLQDGAWFDDAALR